MSDDVLLTDPSWVPLFVPRVASVADATDIIADGAIVTIDGNAATVTIHSLPA